MQNFWVYGKRDRDNKTVDSSKNYNCEVPPVNIFVFEGNNVLVWDAKNSEN